MKIIFVSPQLYPCKTGGAEIFNYYFFKRLAEIYETKVITFCDKYPGEKQVLSKVRPLKFFTPLQVLLHLFKNRDADIVHLSFMGKASRRWVIYPLMKKLFGLNYIVTIHGGGLYKWKPYWPLKLFFYNAKSITAVSKRAKEEYEKRTSKEVIYTPPLVPLQTSPKSISQLKIKYNLPDDSKVVLYVGSIRKQKGTDIFLKAFSLFDSDFLKRNNIYLVLAGDGNIREELETYYKETKIGDYVRFLGRIKNESINELYKLADVYIISSHFENTPLSLIEAMYNKNTIIAADAPGINNIIDNNVNGLLYHKDNPDELYSKLKYIIEHHERAKALASNANQYYYQNYNYEDLVKTFIKQFEDAAK